jgi:hypothetical protein
VGALVDAEVAHASLGQETVDAGLIGTLGEPEAFWLAEAPRV